MRIRSDESGLALVLGERLLVQRELLLDALAGDRRDNAELGVIERHARAQGDDVLAHLEREDLLRNPVHEGKAVELAAVRLEQNGLEVLDLALCLRPGEDLLPLDEVLEGKGLTPRVRATPNPRTRRNRASMSPPFWQATYPFWASASMALAAAWNIGSGAPPPASNYVAPAALRAAACAQMIQRGGVRRNIP